MQRLAITAAILAATWTAPASAGWYSFNNSNACCGCGCGHGFAHQLHSMSPEQLWAGYCQEKANRHGCRSGLGCGCGPAYGGGACGCGPACGGGACGCGARLGGAPCGVGRDHCGGLPGPSCCGGDECGCTTGCTGANPLTPVTDEPGSTADAEYGANGDPDFDSVQVDE